MKTNIKEHLKFRKFVGLINESQYKRLIKEDETTYNIINKKVGEVFYDVSGINMIEDKVIAYSKFFERGGDFDAIGKARDYLKSEGYEYGSMYMDYPIAFMKMGKTGITDDNKKPTTLLKLSSGEERPLVITKFDRLWSADWDNMDGAIISNDMRNGDVYVIFFNFPD
jgi:hypothetical protein